MIARHDPAQDRGSWRTLANALMNGRITGSNMVKIL